MKINTNVNSWKKELYIASKKEIIKDEYNNEIIIYDTPVKYEFNYQFVSSNADVYYFGEKTKITQKAVIPIEYKNIFKEWDLAYLDGQLPTNETSNGNNANYRLLPPQIGNNVIIIYFEKIVGK